MGPARYQMTSNARMTKGMSISAVIEKEVMKSRIESNCWILLE